MGGMEVCGRGKVWWEGKVCGGRGGGLWWEEWRGVVGGAELSLGGVVCGWGR